MTDFIPAAVKAASERSDMLIKGLNEAPVEDGKTSENPEAKPEPKEPAKKENPEQAPRQADNKQDDFETKYRTLQGKYNAEIPRLNDQLRTLQGQVSFLENENTGLKAKNNNQDSGTDDDSRFNPDDYNSYGDEFGTMAKKLNQLMDENENLKKELGNVSNQVNGVRKTQGQDSYDKYMGIVAKKIGESGVDFNQLNADPDFLTWLQDTNPYTGQPRHASLRSAESSLDVERTFGIFKEYLESSPKKKQQPAARKPNVQPNHSASGSDFSPPSSVSNTIWTREKVNQLYKEKSAGAWKNREAEFKALEADMFAAQTEGRFR